MRNDLEKKGLLISSSAMCLSFLFVTDWGRGGPSGFLACLEERYYEEKDGWRKV